MKKIIGLLIFFFTFSSFGSLFNIWEATWKSGYLPTVDSIRGYWAGRCVDWNQPNTRRPAVYVAKIIEGPAPIPSLTYSQSYYRKKSENEALYDLMTPKEVEADLGISQWFQQETWQPLNIISNAIVNFTDLPGYSFAKSVRIYLESHTYTVLLRVSQGPSLPGTSVAYCSFDKYLGQ